jgi:hypothetical protein
VHLQAMQCLHLATVAQQMSAIIPVNNKTQGHLAYLNKKQSSLCVHMYVEVCCSCTSVMNSVCSCVFVYTHVTTQRHNAFHTAALLVQYARCSLILAVSVLHHITATNCTMQPLITTATVKIGYLYCADRAISGQYFIF